MKTMKKVVAIICAIAMVVSSVTVYNNTANAAVADLPESGAGVLIQVNDFGAGDILFLAGLDTIQGATSYNLYVDGTLWGSVVNGQNLELTNFAPGAHTFCVTGVSDGVEIAKSKDVAVTIPDYGTVVVPEVTDGEEILKGTAFTDADTSTGEASDNSLWNELGGTYTNNGDGSVSIAVPAYESGNNWATQLKQNKIQLIKDKWYVAKFTVTSDVEKKIQLLVQHNSNWTVFAEKITTVVAGTTEDVELVFQAPQTTDSVLFGFMMGYVDNTACEAANVTISNVSLKGYNADPNGGEVPSDDNETTTVEDSSEEPSSDVPSGDVETTTPTELPDIVQNESTYAAGFADLMNAAFLLGDVGANQYKAVCGNGLINNIVNIQQPGDATEAGIYVAFKDASFGTMTINGVPLKYYVDGAGVVMYLSNFEYMYSDVVVMSGDGSQKAVIYVYNAQGIDNSDKALEPETPSTGDTPVEITLQRLPATNAHQEFGSYKVAANLNLEAYAGINPNNRDNLQVKNASGPSNDSFTVSRAFKGLVAGTKYVLSVDITPSVANGSYKTLKDADYKLLQEGTTTVSMVSTAYEVNGVTQADFTMYVNKLGADVVLDISNPQAREATEEDLTTTATEESSSNEESSSAEESSSNEESSSAEESSSNEESSSAEESSSNEESSSVEESSSNEESSSVEESTTAEPTTEKVEPTTTKKTKISRPKRTKVNKATKKKTSKKVKVSIKKVKGAAGYGIQFSTTKKFKKVIVKRTVKRRVVTVRSKKLKNKKKLYVRVKAYKLNGKKKVWAKKWSKPKKVNIKK